ncbi:MAG: ComEC/Rec2 family competence protein, partial [Bacteroidota bacterium]
MSLWSRFPFARITLALTGGILVAYSCEGWGCLVGIILAGLLFIYVLAIILVSPAQYHACSALIGLLGLGGVFLMGYLRFEASEVRRAPDHLMQLNASVVAYEAIVLEDASEKLNRCSVVVAVRRVRVQDTWKQVQGKVRLSFPQDTAPQARYGDVLLVRGAPSVVPSASNPHEFDYAAFLGLSQVYHQHFLAKNEMAVIGHHAPNLIQAWSFKVLRYCQSLFSQHIHGPAARAVVQALVLGQKDALTPAVRSAYAGTGTMHVLAVSGLHVGILYWLVSLLLGLLRPLPYMRWLSPVLSVGVLWFYAFVTGLSPSVLRATLMFTLVLLAPVLARQSNIYNTLAASAFLLLFWNPRWLFSVSFQLSYLAVLGIVYLQPKIYGSFSIHHPFLNRLWLWASISIAAQITTFPISVYYFHQFPTYFIVANWVVVPAALLILCFGLLVLGTGFWPGLSGLVAWILEKVVEGVNA